MSQAFASLPNGRVLQYHNVTPAHFFASYAPALFRLASIARDELATLAPRYRPRPRRLGIQPPGARRAGFRQTGVMPIAVDTGRLTQCAPTAGAGRDSRRRVREFSVRRPDRAQQEDRGSHQAGRAVQAVHRRVLPLHFRWPLRRRAAVLCGHPGADGRVQDAAGSVHLHRAGARRASSPRITGRRACTFR